MLLPTHTARVPAARLLVHHLLCYPSLIEMQPAPRLSLQSSLSRLPQYHSKPMHARPFKDRRDSATKSKRKRKSP